MYEHIQSVLSFGQIIPPKCSRGPNFCTSEQLKDINFLWNEFSLDKLYYNLATIPSFLWHMPWIHLKA